MVQHKYTNTLIHETSPYLLQHAHNPVDWMPWGELALSKAKKENKPILVSIGYSACHWCHVMEHESFEDETIAALMNEHFICIKVDREERPDVDQLYMSAVQLMTKRGGWPLNCIALPDGRPFWGGTYFPRDDWASILQQIANVFKEDRPKLETYASQLAEGIEQSAVIKVVNSGKDFDQKDLIEGVNSWKHRLDFEMGGNAGSPKFMIPNNLQFLMEYGHLTKDRSSLLYVETTLEKIALGGIYDHVGGGFSRYSTDKIWKVPHFEKMLYDNAQLISLYSQAYRQTENPLYHSVVRQSIQFIQRELMAPEDLFYSALDADSEGVEGKFYVWNKEQLKSILGHDFELFSKLFNVNQLGYWEHDNYILHRTETNEEFAKAEELTIEVVNNKLQKWQDLLLVERSKRIRPGLDDKSLTSWNAMMGEAMIEAYLSFGDREYLDLAVKNAEALVKFQMDKNGHLRHSYKKGISKIDGFLEDYAFVISFYIRLFEASTEVKWLNFAEQLMNYTNTKLSDEDKTYYWFSEVDPHLPVTRQKEVHDNVIAASNSVMAHNLFKLGHLVGNAQWIERSRKMMNNTLISFKDYPSGYSNWARVFLYHQSYFEIAIVGKDATDRIHKFHATYHPNVLYCGSIGSDLYLTKQRGVKDKTMIYVCQNNTCQLPVETVEKALEHVK